MVDELIPIRLSHLLGQNSVGAIVRGANGLVVVQDTRSWTDRHGVVAGKFIPYVDRVRAALGVDGQLREPPTAKELDNGKIEGICVPASRFPSWTRCPACGAMYRWPWRKDQPDEAPRCRKSCCSNNKPKLEQVSWILAHEKGYLSDVDWHHLLHSEQPNPEQRACRVKDQLVLKEDKYDKRKLRCGDCKAEVDFHGNERQSINGWMQPWTRKDVVSRKHMSEGSDYEPAQVLVINDTRVYSPVAESVLVIPPESRVRKGTVIDRLYRNSGDRSRLDSARTPLNRKGVMRALAAEYRCTMDDIKVAMEDLERGYPLFGEIMTAGQMRESEFEAFLEVLPDQREDEDLVTRNRSEQWRALALSEDLDAGKRKCIEGIRHLVRVDRLKAVKVFKGFTRLGGEDIVPPDIVGQSDWLPALELYGEGIFYVLDEERISQWEEHPSVVSRLDNLLPRFTQSGHDAPNPLTTRFMLLHTLSHLMMRQIESEGGYPASSLVERIYCSQGPVPMAGILIHVAVPDVAGSLGGLAELCEPQRFLGILSRAIEHSRWCSLDPVCSEHEGQGPGLLNRAACHACALVPEPACEFGNILLDRGFVKGDPDNGLPSFFGFP